MRVLLQRITEAEVRVDGKSVSATKRGYLLFLGIIQGDTETEAKWLAEKISKLRLFDAETGKVNDRSILDIDGDILVVSQFTLAGDTAKGNRPDYTSAADPVLAEALYERFMQYLRECGVRRVESGKFRAMMEVQLTNDGPVTLLLERGPVAK